jgi:hypothetical protein
MKQCHLVGARRGRAFSSTTALAIALGFTALGCGDAPEPESVANTPESVGTQTESLSTTLAPSLDTYVRDGGSASSNFATAATLDVKKSTSGYNREAYLRFNLSSFAGTVQSAKLRVYGKLTEAGTVPVVARLLSSDIAPFSASTTWSTKPQTMPIELGRAQVTGTTAAWYELDVTSLVREKKRNGGASIDLALVSPVTTTPLAQFNSSEAATNRPELVISTASALLVVGNTTLGAGDNAVKNRLTQLGFTVTVKAASAATSADATGQTVVLVSSTVASGDVAAKFRDVTVPVVAWENAIFDDMKLTGTVAGTDYGTASAQTSVNVATPSHALAGGRTGTNAVSGSSNFTWGKPSASAVKAATLPSDASKATLFGYEKGAAMVGMNAPARRVGLFLEDTTANSLSKSGWALFDAAVNWASGSKAFVVKKLLVINYEPYLEAYGQTLSQHYNWPGAHQIVDNFVRDISEITGDYLRYQVVDFRDLDAYPPEIGLSYGATYNDAAYVADFDSGHLQDAPADYTAIINQFGIDAAINAGTYDEVFIAAPTSVGFAESNMAGKDAYWVNGGEITRPGVRNYFFMYVNNMMHWSNFEHSYMHRLENIMRHVYAKLGYGQDASGVAPSNWNTNPYDFSCLWTGASPSCGAQRRHLWDDFTLVDGVAQNLRARGDSSAKAGVGTMHFAVNAQSQSADNYNWGQPWVNVNRSLPAVTSRADDWLYNFPNLTGESRLVDMSEYPFGPTDDKYQWGYVMFLFNHVPRVPGRHADGALFNWWEYAASYNDYPEALK